MSFYVYANVKLKYGKGPEFNETMARVKPLFEARGWKLIGGWQTVVGDLNEVHDLWEIEELNVIPTAMASAFEDPEFASIAAALMDQVEREVISVVVKTPYSP